MRLEQGFELGGSVIANRVFASQTKGLGRNTLYLFPGAESTA